MQRGRCQQQQQSLSHFLPPCLASWPQGKGTALHHATHSGYPEVVSLLLEKGANPKAQDNRGERPGDKFDPEVRIYLLAHGRVLLVVAFVFGGLLCGADCGGQLVFVMLFVLDVPCTPLVAACTSVYARRYLEA